MTCQFRMTKSYAAMSAAAKVSPPWISDPCCACIKNGWDRDRFLSPHILVGIGNQFHTSWNGFSNLPEW